MRERVADRSAAIVRFCRILLAAAFILATASLQAAAQQVVVLVNGAPITTYDIEQRTKFLQLSTRKTPTRQEVIDELINETVKLQEARRYAMDAPKADVERAIANMASRSGVNVAQFTQMLAGHGINLETIRARVRADIAWNQLVRGRFPATLQIDEREIRDILEAKKEDSGALAYDYRLRPILFIVPKGSPNAVVEGRMREAESLRSRFQGCEEGVAAARGLKDVAVRDAVRRTSADLPPALREVLDATPVGKLTKPEVTAQGVEVFALCEKTPTTSDTPQKRSARQEIFATRFDAQSKRYLNEVRRSSMIEYR